jgi:hypothetical protein
MQKKLLKSFIDRKCYVCARVLEKLEVSAIVNIDGIEEHYCLCCHVFSYPPGSYPTTIYSVPKCHSSTTLFENLRDG